MAVDNAAPSFDRLYDYAVPPQLKQKAVIGARVVVPFGRGAARVGIIMGVGAVMDAAKELLAAEDEPALDSDAVDLIRLLKEQTFCTYFDAIRTILPKSSRAVARADDGGWRLAELAAGHLETVYSAGETPQKATARQQQIVAALGGDELTFEQLRGRTGLSRETAARMVNNGALRKSERKRDAALYRRYEPAAEFELTQPQQRAFEQIENNIAAGKKTTLLRGVTGSGKTMIYIKLIERALAQGRGVIVLVPEITIATQTIYRLKEIFGERVGVIHSSLSDSERQLQWLAARSGECDIIAGTRSAVFAPVRDLGLIIVDEEQEQSYCSEHSPRYNAVAVARHRAARCGAHVLLASATPAVESYYRAESGTYGLVEVEQRYNDVPLPAVHVVDMRTELADGNTHTLSDYLYRQMAQRLQDREQTILLLNRRGYRTVSICEDCGTVLKCKNCDVPMVLHRSGAYICHYCGATLDAGAACAQCGGELRHRGVGTQRIEEELSELFPTARVLRMDADAVSRKDSYERCLFDFARGDYDILVGTQMIAKGLDFKNVTLVGVLGIDSLLFLPSYRAYERTFAMLTQVVGRSGRGSAGEAVIQTLDPTNPVISYAKRQDYRSFYRDEIALRRANLYPPFCALCLVGFVGPDEPSVSAAAAAFAECISVAAQNDFADVPLRLLGPAPLRVALVGGMYRWRITVKCRGDRRFRDLLRRAMADYQKRKPSREIRIFADFAADADS